MFVDTGQGTRAQVLDVQNAMVFARDTPEWKQLRERKPRIYKWAPEDPLTDVFLIQLGAYPDRKSVQIDYESTFKGALGASESDQS